MVGNDWHRRARVHEGSQEVDPPRFHHARNSERHDFVRREGFQGTSSRLRDADYFFALSFIGPSFIMPSFIAPSFIIPLCICSISLMSTMPDLFFFIFAHISS